ncbi:MAG: VTT domain-containing protein [Pseudomonadota bacterium]
MKAASLLRGALALLLVGGIVAAAVHSGGADSLELQALLDRAGVAAPLVFIAIYAAGAVLFLPGSVFTFAAGALFGPVAGAFYSLTGATLGATLAFLCARYVAGEWVRRRAAGRLQALLQGVEADGWRFVAFVRLMPLFPFNGLNYALGLTRIPLAQYVAASYVAMLPGAAAYAYLGYAGREALTGSETLIQNGLIALALLAAVAFLPRLVQRLRRRGMDTMAEIIDAPTLKRRLEGGEPQAILDVRNPDEYHGELGHIRGALNIPVAALPDSLPQLEPFKDKSLVVVCRTDKRSAKAAELLRGKGFRRVLVLRGGMEQWNRQGFPIARQANPNPTGNLHGQDAYHP